VILPFSPNAYGGVVIDPKALPADTGVFLPSLVESLESWKQEGFVYVWLEIPITKSQLIPLAVEAGFGFHHSSPDYLMMTKKLEPEVAELPFASHYVGVGGAVLTEDNNVLVVRERMRRENRLQPFKLPGGYVHSGEHLSKAVEREVWEETGVKAVFQSVVCVRLWHANRFGKSDFYFVCRLQPLSFEIVPQEEEIAEACWMPVEAYLARDDVHQFNKGIVSLAAKGKGMRSSWFEGYDQDPIGREIFFLKED
jgi:8-oxo-dGTP pyrophosphatase MutT (NUDIX family)